MVQKIDGNQITMSNGYSTPISLDACIFLVNGNTYQNTYENNSNSVLNQMHIAFFWYKKKKNVYNPS